MARALAPIASALSPIAWERPPMATEFRPDAFASSADVSPNLMYLTFSARAAAPDEDSALVIRVSSAVTAPSTPLTELPPTVYVGLEMVPFALTTEPPPMAVAWLAASE
jgi:hypothetical protein